MYALPLIYLMKNKRLSKRERAEMDDIEKAFNVYNKLVLERKSQSQTQSPNAAHHPLLPHCSTTANRRARLPPPPYRGEYWFCGIVRQYAADVRLGVGRRN